MSPIATIARGGEGVFADVKRTRTGGKGFAGVVARDEAYLNPFLRALERA